METANKSGFSISSDMIAESQQITPSTHVTQRTDWGFSGIQLNTEGQSSVPPPTTTARMTETKEDLTKK